MEKKPFEQALLDASLESFADIPTEEEIELELSEEFLINGEKLIRKSRRGSPHKSKKTLRRIILVAAVIAALVAMAVATTAFRYDLFQYTVTDCWTYYEFSYTDELPSTARERIETVYKPTYIPEGFELGRSEVYSLGTAFSWYSEEGAVIAYQQSLIKADDVFLRQSKRAENLVVDGVLMGDYQVLCVTSDMGTMYFWTDGEYFHYLGMDAVVSEAEHLKIFHSIAVDEDAVISDP